MRLWKAVSKHATAGTSGRDAPTAAIASRAAGWCSGASGELAQRLVDLGVEEHRTGEAGPAVDDSVRDRVGIPHPVDRLAELRGVGSTRRCGELGVSEQLVLVTEEAQLERLDPALTVRTFMTPPARGPDRKARRGPYSAWPRHARIRGNPPLGAKSPMAEAPACAKVVACCPIQTSAR